MANQPSLIPSAWAANNSTTETIPATTSESGKASWDQGFPVETSLPLSEGGIPPKYGDFNGILNVLSQFCLFAQSGGQYTWSSTLSYSVGSIVVGSDGSIYRAVQATTNVNPVGDTSGKWERIVSQSDITALETGIQTAMTNAANAVSNASAAQSAVTTLDANVVKLSGDQSVGGTKTFTSSVYIQGTGVMGFSTKNTTSNRQIDLCTQDNGNAGIWDTTNNRWMIHATNGGVTDVPNGLTTTAPAASDNSTRVPTTAWVGSNTVMLSGDQNVGGLKTFTTSPVIKRANPYLDLVETDWEKGTDPGATTYQGIHFADKNGDYGGAVYFHYTRSKTCQTELCVFNKNDDGVTNYDRRVALECSKAGATYFYPNLDDNINLGSANYRWKQLYATTTTISTSDERLKDNITVVPDAVLDAWGEVDWKQFQFKDALAEKGEDKARLHNGLIAQRIDEVFKAHGLDASRYGLFCHDEWEAEPEEKDDEGNVIREARPAGDMYSLRYEEALCMEAAYQRRRADRAEARITALERRLDEMEAVLASLLSPVGDETYAEPEQEQVAEQEGE